MPSAGAAHSSPESPSEPPTEDWDSLFGSAEEKEEEARKVGKMCSRGRTPPKKAELQGNKLKKTPELPPADKEAFECYRKTKFAQWRPLLEEAKRAIVGHNQCRRHGALWKGRRLEPNRSYRRNGDVIPLSEIPCRCLEPGARDAILLEAQHLAVSIGRELGACAALARDDDLFGALKTAGLGDYDYDPLDLNSVWRRAQREAAAEAHTT